MKEKPKGDAVSKEAPPTEIKAKRKPNDNKVNGICAVEGCNQFAVWEHPCCSEKCEAILIKKTKESGND